jgi:hypothetical protein
MPCSHLPCIMYMQYVILLTRTLPSLFWMEPGSQLVPQQAVVHIHHETYQHAVC